MMKSTNKKYKLLKKKVLGILFFLITFFIFKTNTDAAYFKYSEFDFDKFAEENKNYWTSSCNNEKDKNGEEKCIEVVLGKQRIYYTRLYKLLAKYQRNGYLIDDNILIATIFYDLTPDLLTDNGEFYKRAVGVDENAFNYNENLDLDNYDVNAEMSVIDYKEETDTLEILMKNMFSYSFKCYGIYGSPTSETVNGETTYKCSNGGKLISINGSETCASVADSKNIGFSEYMESKFGLGDSGAAKDNCKALASQYPEGTKFDLPNKKQFTPEKYWEYLENSTYFDNKAHLKHYFAGVLAETSHNKMSELTEEEYEEHKDRILYARQRIINGIKSILDVHGASNSINLNSVNNSNYWWPIGSSEETNSSGKIFAMGEPATLTITSKFGLRTDPVYGGDSFHKGIDIAGGGSAGNVNIIAARDGIVQNVSSNCSASGDNSCGGGYGNYVILSHGDGNYTMYAHLHPGTITVTDGAAVSQGEVVGKMGNSGKSTGTHLHFEIRVGSNESSAAVDPLTFISASDPRAASVSAAGEAVSMLRCLEGKGPDDGGANYTVYSDNGKDTGTLTVGPGVTLKYNVSRFSSRGIDINSYSYIGALIPKQIVDEIENEIISAKYDSINAVLSASGISLESHQVDALLIRQYNTGNIDNFVASFKSYGNTESLYTNYMSTPVTAKGHGTSAVLKTRREREWNLFRNGIYYTC